MNITFETEVYFTVKVKVTHYTPYRPAPFCSNHDSPNFADSGDDLEIEYDATVIMYKQETDPKTMKTTQVKVKEFPLPDEMYEVLEAQLSEEAIHEAELYNDMQHETAMDDKFESMKDR